MQTVIQIDGDVITRVQPKHALAKDDPLHVMHGKAVRTSINFWKDLIGIATDFLESLLKLLIPGR